MQNYVFHKLNGNYSRELVEEMEASGQRELGPDSASKFGDWVHQAHELGQFPHEQNEDDKHHRYVRHVNRGNAIFPSQLLKSLKVAYLSYLK